MALPGGHGVAGYSADSIAEYDLGDGANGASTGLNLAQPATLVPGGAALKKAVTVASKAYSAYQTGIDVIETGERLVEAAQSGGLQGLAAAVGEEAQSRVEAKVVGAITGGVARGVAAVGKSAKARVSAASSESPDGATAAVLCTSGTCFPAGTPVARSDCSEPIEEISVGERVLTPDALTREGETAVDPATWRKVTVTLIDPAHPGDVHDVVLLRPLAWLEAQQIRRGGRLWLALEEIGARGWATGEDIGPCPPLASGPGRVVLLTVTHRNDFLYRLGLRGAGGSAQAGETGGVQELEVTGYHRLWSASRQDWVAVKDLHPQERLLTRSGEVTATPGTGCPACTGSTTSRSRPSTATTQARTRCWRTTTAIPGRLRGIRGIRCD